MSQLNTDSKFSKRTGILDDNMIHLKKHKKQRRSGGGFLRQNLRDDLSEDSDESFVDSEDEKANAQKEIQIQVRQMAEAELYKQELMQYVSEDIMKIEKMNMNEIDFGKEMEGFTDTADLLKRLDTQLVMNTQRLDLGPVRNLIDEISKLRMYKGSSDEENYKRMVSKIDTSKENLTSSKEDSSIDKYTPKIESIENLL